MRSAIIIGSTGLVGNELVTALSKNDNYDKIFVIARRPVKFDHEKIEPVVIDFSDLDKQIFPLGADYFCALGTTIKQAGSKAQFRKVDYEYVISFAKLAKKYEARSFHLISALGASVRSINFYSRVKGEVEKSVVGLGLKKVRIYQPSLLIGARQKLGQSSRWVEDVSMAIYKKIEFLFAGMLKKYEPITAEKVAAAMIKNALADLPSEKMIISNKEMH